MKKLILVFLISAVTFLVSSCGVKGPLYFPEQEQSAQQQ
ncbi:putative lipoprotein [Bisgaardia hudsonensis]|uniref:Putative lipoprotein n=1 Tax=Bisgaardia hudsonensis TaxID=109472 RepID=A0A4V2SIV9_9PAST|nr:lipoprotein [Bisgaardia hudsonensis]TCP11508.1 putative lipoprotein [Bisgaardia hudsonensis]